MRKRFLCKTALHTLCIGMLAWIPLAGQAQAPTVEWDKTYGGKSRDVLTAFVNTPDKGYIAGGSSQSGKSGEKDDDTRGGEDFWIVKMDMTGNIEWQRTFGGDGDDELRSIKAVKGGYIVGGTSNSPKSGDKDDDTRGREDYWILKLNDKGDIEWQKTIGGNEPDRLATVIETPDGGFLAGGTSGSPKSGDKTEDSKGFDNREGYGSDYWIVKLNSKGDIEWDKTIGGVGVCQLKDVVADGDGYLLGGYSNSAKGNDKSEDTRGNYDYWVVRVNENGDVQWDKTIGGDQSDQLSSMVQTKDGGYVLAGSSSSAASGNKKEPPVAKNSTDYWVVKIDRRGSYEWERVIGSVGTDYARSIIKTDDEGFLLAGYSDGSMSGQKSEDSKGKNTHDFWVLKLNEKGDVEWDKTLGGSGAEDGGSIMLPAADVGFIVAGPSSSSKSGDKSESSRGEFDYWVVKLKTCTPVKNTASASFCKGGKYSLPDGRIVSTAGVYTSIVKGKTGCDDTTVTTLTENPVYNIVLNAFVCTGGDYTLPDGRIVFNPGFYTCRFKTIGVNCDSTIVVSLTVGDADTIKSNDFICAGGTYTMPGGTVVNGVGVHYASFTSVGGCDSVLEITLTESAVDTGITIFGKELSANASSGTFQWIDCATGKNVSGATNRNFEATVTGNYAVVVTVGNCVDTSSCYAVTVTAGVTQVDADGGMALYPNPARDQFVIKGTRIMGQVTVLNMLGAVVYQATPALAMHTVPVGSWTAGVYLVRVHTTAGVSVGRIEIIK